MTPSVIVTPDDENNAEIFWDAFREAVETLPAGGELRANCNELLENDLVELTDEKAITEFDAFVTQIAGYSDGPEYAKTALLFVPQ